MDKCQYFSYQKNENYKPRKLKLQFNGKINLFGVRGSGKSSLVLEALNEFEEEKILFIDLKDPKLMFSPLKSKELQEYILKEKIDIVVLDHYEKRDEELLYINIKSLIVITRVALKKQNFKEFELFLLDYEEFLSFSNYAMQGKLNHFLRLGTLPLLANFPKEAQSFLRGFFLANFSIQEREILTILANYNTKQITIYQIYTLAKKYFKISKDSLYATIKALEKEKVLFFILDIEQKKLKKLILFDFVFTKYLSFEENFIRQFDSIIALTLLKQNISIFTLKKSGYIFKNSLISPAPFENRETIIKKAEENYKLYIKEKIKKVFFITISNQYKFNIEEIECEAISFESWSISFG